MKFDKWTVGLAAAGVVVWVQWLWRTRVLSRRW